jgi:hypothetical protein
MKITNAEVIKSGEKDLIDSITADLDWGAIEDIFLTEHNLRIDEDIEYKSGDIVAYENQVAYKLEFTVKVNLSVLINRDGEYLSVNISGNKPEEGQDSAHGQSTDSKHGEGNETMIQEKGVDIADPCLSANDVKEDKYLEALGQLNSDDLNPI